MNGRAYVQKGDRFGWVLRDPKHVIPKTASEVMLTPDVTKSLVFDVDNRDGYSLLNSLIEDGYSVVIGDTFIHNRPAAPSASPFTPIADPSEQVNEFVQKLEEAHEATKGSQMVFK